MLMLHAEFDASLMIFNNSFIDKSIDYISEKSLGPIQPIEPKITKPYPKIRYSN